MQGTPSLDDLGDRICILGPSNSGKSTLAAAIGRRRGLEVIHLDQLHHQPGTDWVPRPADEFAALHDAAILGDRWVIDGKYGSLMPQRIARATGVILLEVAIPVSLWRYIRRTLFERDRIGALEGAREAVTWEMIQHIAILGPGSRRRYAEMFDRINLPKLRLGSVERIDAFYLSEDLSRS